MKKIADSYTEDIISRLAQDETGKRQHYRPVYSLHKWWARRPGALFRAVLLLATNSTDKLFMINGGSLSPYSDYFKPYNLEHLVIFDPFMGGGTTLAEANRLGAKVIGCDLNPVSFWIVRETLKPIDLEKLHTQFKILEQTAGKQIRGLYKTGCIRCKAQADSLYVFWLRSVKCLHCNEEVSLFKRTLLNTGLSRTKPVSSANPATVFCPKCFALNDWNGEFECLCKSCGDIFKPQTGTYNKGVYTCPHCGKENLSLISTLKTGQKLGEKLLAIEYGCHICKDRFYKSPDQADSENLLSVRQTFEQSKDKLIFPKQKISEGASSLRWRKHNFHYYHEIFNERQILAFNYLIKAIRTIPEEEYRNAFLTIFSNSLEYNNMMTPYNYPHRKLHHLFNYHALPLTTTPVENVVWGKDREGAGTFANCYFRYVRAKEYCRNPYDRFKDSRGSVQTVEAKNENISACFVSSFGELEKTPKGALLFCGDSSKLPCVPNNSVDFVITDPPYFDSIHYSELSNFFYVWLKSVADHHCFMPEHVPTEQEAIGNAGTDKGEREYRNLLVSVFEESERVLKKEGKLIFTFHHTRWQVWWTIHSAVTESGFRIIDYFPVMSEYKVNPHIRNKQALDMDLLIVCQKKEMPVEILSHLPAEVLQRVKGNMLTEPGTYSDNRLFLHFMGELLKTAGSAHESETLTYNWFSEALTHFDEFLSKIDRTRHKSYEFPKYHQLKLCESDS
jgi:putative DNA methylase